MKAPDFWRLPQPNWAARLLAPLGLVYGALTGWRMRRSGERMPVPVITIGGFDVGGSGKTPACLSIARLLQARGLRPAFVSRGYGGSNTRRPQQVLRQTAQEIGDEPLLLARVAPCFVGRDRLAAARLALATVAPDVLILDDGLQSRAIEPTVALAAVDGVVGSGNGLCLPAGVLRAPLALQMSHVDGVVIIGAGRSCNAVAAAAKDAQKKQFAADFVTAPEAPDIRDRRVVAFAGIGRPDKFFAFLEKNNAILSDAQAFADHHVFSSAELEILRAKAQAYQALLVTTEKDFARLPPAALIDQPAPIAWPVHLKFDVEAAFVDWLLSRTFGK